MNRDKPQSLVALAVWLLSVGTLLVGAVRDRKRTAVQEASA
jgi:hypothetical protein